MAAAAGSADSAPTRAHVHDERPVAKAAAWMLVIYGLLVAAAALVGLRRDAGMVTAPSWTIFHLVVLLALAVSLLRAQPWAWWCAVALAAVELIMLLPLVAALLGGSGITLLIPRLDLVLVALEALALVTVLVLLLRMRRRA